jgi:hypothetical protein
MSRSIQRYFALAVTAGVILLWVLDTLSHPAPARLVGAGLCLLALTAIVLHQSKPRPLARGADRLLLAGLSEATRLSLSLAFMLLAADALICGVTLSTLWFAGHLVPVIAVVTTVYWLLRRLERRRGSQYLHDALQAHIRRLTRNKPEV